MKFTVGIPENFGAYVKVDRKGNRTVIYKTLEEFKLKHNARKLPTKHLVFYKYLRKLITVLLKFSDSEYFVYK